MKLVVQRVKSARVEVNKITIGSIEQGMLIFIGVGHQSSEEDSCKLAQKVAGLRIFEDSSGKMNLDIKEIGGKILAVSQFTLYAGVKKGKRPDFTQAAKPEMARSLYQHFISELKKNDIQVETGEFGASMEISLLNDGPVTLIIDAKDL